MARQGAYSGAVARGLEVVLDRNAHDIWVLRTPEEVQALRDADARAGRWHDDGGEPILYGPYSSWSVTTLPTLTVRITALRPKWVAYRQRPKGLRAGWCELLKREVLFKSAV